MVNIEILFLIIALIISWIGWAFGTKLSKKDLKVFIFAIYVYIVFKFMFLFL
jgi:hypothetical protein